uniref:Uncharacterized protein n=1 Tax=Eutreptiella gymnastica TaxID=73025 RepID=A0A7S4D1F5_9EUGL
MDLHSASVAGLQAPASNVLTWAGAAIGALVLVCVAVAPQTAERSAVLYQPVSVGVRAPETALMAARGRGKNRGRVAVEEPKKETGNFVSNFVNAIDFAAPRSKEDAELLYEAKYGKRETGKMSREQYGALRRKVGGTYSDYFKEWVDVKGKYTDRGYVGDDSGVSDTASYGAFLLGLTVLGVLGTLVLVVQKTG